MVVVRIVVIAALFAAGAMAQSGSARAWVDKTTQKVGEPFQIRIEASGRSVSTPSIPAVANLVLRSPQSSISSSRINGRSTQTVALAYRATATRPGRLVFPPVTVQVDGQMIETDPIELTILGSVADEDAVEHPVQAWVDSTTVTAGEPFRLYVEGVGMEVTIPNPKPIDGIAIDTGKTIESRTAARHVGDRMKRVQHGFHAVAERPGTLGIPALEVEVNGRTYATLPFEVSVIERRRPAASDETELTTEDLVFTEMYVDQEEVYQGEPVVLSMELWRIDRPPIESGSYRGADIRYPSTEGFYGAALEPVTRSETLGTLTYNVTADRRVLYPTKTGLLSIGTWHWEGIARWPNRNPRAFSLYDDERYALDQGPITVNVKPLPADRPDSFSGAVGTFVLSVEISEETFLQGVPVKVIVTVRGAGNPDAIGEPVIPPVTWAHVSSPQRETESSISRTSSLVVAKYFTYTVTPLEPGSHSLGPVEFVFFDPEQEAFRTESAGPYALDVLPSAESGQRLVVGADVSLGEEGVAILGEDIRPPASHRDSLEAERSGSGALPALIVLPVLVYLGLFAYTARKRRFSDDHAFARRYRAKSNAQKRLADMPAEADPSDALYRIMVDFLGDAFNVDKAGMTSDDARELLGQRGVDAQQSSNIVKVMRACERARYASQPLSAVELSALAGAAEAAITHIDDVSRKGGAA